MQIRNGFQFARKRKQSVLENTFDKWYRSIGYELVFYG